ncbi:MAG: hypothetical protein AAB657_01150 [Patescibacteria group bacterium]
MRNSEEREHIFDDSFLDLTVKPIVNNDVIRGYKIDDKNEIHEPIGFSRPTDILKKMFEDSRYNLDFYASEEDPRGIEAERKAEKLLGILKNQEAQDQVLELWKQKSELLKKIHEINLKFEKLIKID